MSSILTLSIPHCCTSLPNAGGGNRTHMGLLPGDFKSPASTISPPRQDHTRYDLICHSSYSLGPILDIKSDANKVHQGSFTLIVMKSTSLLPDVLPIRIVLEDESEAHRKTMALRRMNHHSIRVWTSPRIHTTDVDPSEANPRPHS